MHCLLISPLKASEISFITLSIQRYSGNHKPSSLLQINPFTPGNFAENRILKLVEQFSSHCLALLRAKTYHKALLAGCHFVAF